LSLGLETRRGTAVRAAAEPIRKFLRFTQFSPLNDEAIHEHNITVSDPGQAESRIFGRAQLEKG
jgi:hypothetical protein